MPRTKADPPKTPKRRTRTRLEKGALVSIALGKLACATPAPSTIGDPPGHAELRPQTPPSAAPAATPAPTNEAAVAATDNTAEVLAKLDPYIVTPPKIARKTLYTWTTLDQIEELAKDRILLTRTDSPKFGASYFEQVLHVRAETTKDPLAKLLRTNAYARARFAWSAPWATLLGIGGESYGEELIEITLKPEAWIVAMYSSNPAFEVFDLEGRKIPNKDALAHPERIAAVYFEHDQPARGYAASIAGPEERAAYREYIVCNESMVASWSTRTDAIRKEITDSADALEALAKNLAERPPSPREMTGNAGTWSFKVPLETWRLANPTPSPLSAYETSIAFPEGAYTPTPQNLLRLAQKLRALSWQGAPITYFPSAKFSPKDIQNPAKPPRAYKPTGRGTF